MADDIKEIVENQDAIVALCNFAGLSKKYTTRVLTAYTAMTACNKIQKDLFYRALHCIPDENN
ncbi:MAG: hypothetical protein K6C11_02860 [Bacilli bacterium]|nr:hypothetical protein [Bacilli bacterium]